MHNSPFRGWFFCGQVKLFMPNTRNIQLQISAAHFILLALLFGLGMQIVSTIGNLQSLSSDLYTHPFRISNTAMDAQAKIVTIRDDMMEMALEHDPAKQAELSRETFALDAGIRSDLKLIHSAFLGDTGRVDEIDRQLGDWQQFRSKIAGLIRQGEPGEARQLMAGPGEQLFKRILGNTDYVVDFARKRAEFFARKAASESASRVREIRWLLGGLAVLFSLLIFLVTRRILAEFRKNNAFTGKLLESEQKFQLLFEEASDCIMLLSTEGRIVDINRIGHERLGYSKEEMVGRRIAEFDTTEHAPRVRERVAKVMKTGYASFEAAHVCKNHLVMPVEINASLIEINGNQLILSVVRDISERKRMEEELAAKESRYRGVIETSLEGFWIVDMQGHLLEVNDAYVELSGYSREELLAMSIPDLEAKENPEETAAHIENVMKNGYDRFESLHKTRDGKVWPVEVAVSFWPMEGGRFFVFCRDITERRDREEEQRLAMTVFQNIGEGMTVTDSENRVVAVNPAFTHLTGYTAEEMMGKNPNLLSSGHHDSEFYRQMWKMLAETGQWQGEVWDRRKDGELIAKWLTISTIYDDTGSVHQRVALFSDITQKKQSDEVIWRQANFDPLTQLPNRRMFREQLEQEIRKAQRNGASLALFFIDLDHFKEINDTLGHHVGDELLVEAAKRIMSCVRESDIVARLGGDEFTVILGELSDKTRIEQAAQNVIARLAEPFQLGGEVAYVSASVGITLYPDDTDSAHNLIKHADQAMYEAKSQGRSRFSYFTPQLQEEAMKRLKLTTDMRNALAKGQFRVHFQPIVDLSTGCIRKAEALLRWQHPEQGMVSPMDFVPLAEETGMINEIGDWVFREAANLTKQLQAFSPAFQISVNTSPVQFHSALDHFGEWPNYLKQLGLKDGSIAVEITEGLLLETKSSATDRLHAMREAGLQISLDDFGTGYSSLSYLKQYPIDYLKIDQSFVRDMTTDPNDQALCEAIVVMAHKLDLKVIAEGVETTQQRDLLLAMGCDYGQGYLFSKPLPAEAFAKLVTDGN